MGYQVAIMHKGEVVRQGTVADLTKQEGRYALALAPGQTFPQDAIAQLGFKVEVVGGHWEVTVGQPERIDAILSIISEKGLSLRHLVEVKQSLEDVFMTMVEKSDTAADRRGVRMARPVVARRIES